MAYTQSDLAAQNRFPWYFGAKIGLNWFHLNRSFLWQKSKPQLPQSEKTSGFLCPRLKPSLLPVRSSKM
ncbi:hypothetical protein P7228_09020 [Altererythrobacter arenosus]|uniref:Uncharacterized protein n=1 Tax=Altererythrobacter arenosus TaxID=3032592 RepID=A0ABY8FQG4_9SPHN|nr:hypothetical protein [Altererythrobacter sp. CAU 1644]WFL76143.1 hypothetical protein P7228_09020 [Altererythrobacter sp. CAU 1644]